MAEAAEIPQRIKFVKGEFVPEFPDECEPHTPDPEGYLQWDAWAEEPATVEPVLRCQRNGCRQKWPVRPENEVPVAEKPTVHDVMTHLDEVSSKTGLARACMWGAVRATAPADRWDHAKTDLEAAAASLAAALEALGAMEKFEAYCTICGQPILHLMAGWSHFADGGRAASTGHKPALDWREIGTPGKRTLLCPNCHAEPAGEDGVCWSCAEGDEYE